MSNTKAWLEAARLRTLPLSVSGILVGSFYAYSQGFINWGVFSLALVTTLGLQILSNFANDYGDGVKGTDNEHRIGPQRAIQSGAISVQAMKKGIIITSLLTLAAAVILIYLSFGKENFAYSVFFFFLGLAAISAAIKYTVGSSAYGYRGLGDLFVFIFFGLVSVIGCYFLFAQKVDSLVILPAVSVGLLSVAVLNLNNMRDQVSDAMSGKNTLVVKMGAKVAKVYHYAVIITALSLTLAFALLNHFRPVQYIFTLAYIPFLIHIKTVVKNTVPRELDPELKKVALGTFFLSVLLCVAMQL
ncbi:1,4-dihydroxy-2-naphthoate prenyltransferase [Flavobacterium akiainvivens]|uniref:1,4-dihydroxy-2-naphthoate octaprenyltransferase n=1 Tax=Flavobacterium akiainvivens TaxID=1202724 RepID=A0A0M8M9C6_9FLAO|nr:1,4-dihydroxy-2-naphthoate octaprenyltransferase [Flavobacterium akiainvivens]KOS05235.1 1,4-dihydroxy-2-naphthoate prenyltransferase [Flavobacterium akiainvivens]SFQ50351.1 1,4-dihydroxy-2-naphthoate prenyltransferase [Flavobacterium akiainvivens]